MNHNKNIRKLLCIVSTVFLLCSLLCGCENGIESKPASEDTEETVDESADFQNGGEEVDYETVQSVAGEDTVANETKNENGEENTSMETPLPENSYILYVAPDGIGSDENDGSAEHPLATIKEAIRKIRSAKSEYSVVYLHGGRYCLSAGQSFTQLESNIAFIACEGEKPIIDGSICLTGTWDGTEEINGYTAWVRDISDITGCTEFNTLFSDKGFLVNARYPADGKYLYAKAGGRAQNPNNSVYAGNLSLIANASDLPDISEENLAHARIRILHYWCEDMSPLKSYDPVSGEIIMKNTANNTIAKGDAYCLENIRAGLDEEGEWYVDYSAKKLYYIPKVGETQDSAPIYLGICETLVNIGGAKNISFTGISFEHTNWKFAKLSSQSAYGEKSSCVKIENASGINFIDCSFRAVGTTCINFGNYDTPVSECQVSGCRFEEIGMQAVVISGQNNESSCSKNITVENCLIAGYGRTRTNAAGILQTHAYGISIRNNEIHDGGYTAISTGWTWGYADTVYRDNEVVNNLIYHIGHVPLSDMGGIYTLGTQTNSTISGNVIFDVCAGADATTYGGWGIYPDEGSNGFTITNNICFDCGSQGYHQHYGKDNNVYNNIFAFNEDGQVRSSRTEDHNQFILHNNILAGSNQLMYQNVEAGRFTDSDNLYYDYNTADGSVFSGSVKDASSSANMNNASMRKIGYYKNGVFENPNFTDSDNRNFTFSDMTAADKIGFVPIDCSKVGAAKFGSCMLVNTLKYPDSRYPSELLDEYETAKTAFIAERTEDTIDALTEAYTKLYSFDSAAEYTGLCIDFADGAEYEAYTAALETAVKSSGSDSMTDAVDRLDKAHEALISAEAVITLVNGNDTETVKAKFGDTVNLTKPSADNSIFTGWLGTDGRIYSDSIIAGAGEFTLTAQWTEAYTLEFIGYPEYTRAVGAGLALGELPVPENTDIIFGGWSTSENSENAVDDKYTMPSADLKLYPIVREKSVIILELNNRDAAMTSNSRLECGAGEHFGELPTPSCAKMRFVGWNTEKDGSGETVSSDDIIPSGEMTLYAQWTQCYELLFDNEYSLNDAMFNTKSAGGNDSSAPTVDAVAGTISFTVEGGNCFLSTPVKMMRLTGGNTYRISYVFTENGEETTHSRLTLMPYDKNGKWGESYYVEKTESDSEYIVTEPYTKIAFRPGASGAEVGSVVCYSDIAVQDITGCPDKSAPMLDGEQEFTRSVDVGSKVGVLPTETRTGYTFIGWNTEKDGSGEIYTEDTVMPSKTVHLWPMWQKNG